MSLIITDHPVEDGLIFPAIRCDVCGGTIQPLTRGVFHYVPSFTGGVLISEPRFAHRGACHEALDERHGHGSWDDLKWLPITLLGRWSRPWPEAGHIYRGGRDDRARVRDAPCRICGRAGDLLDHSHRTGRTRGMLCGSCNVKLGFLEAGRSTSSPDWEAKARLYLAVSEEVFDHVPAGLLV